VGVGVGVVGARVAVGGAVGCGVTLAAGVDEGEVVGPVVSVAFPSPVTGWVADGVPPHAAAHRARATRQRRAAVFMKLIPLEYEWQIRLQVAHPERDGVRSRLLVAIADASGDAVDAGIQADQGRHRPRQAGG
jgi:hypothetical protein